MLSVELERSAAYSCSDLVSVQFSRAHWVRHRRRITRTTVCFIPKTNTVPHLADWAFISFIYTEVVKNQQRFVALILRNCFPNLAPDLSWNKRWFSTCFASVTWFGLHLAFWWETSTERTTTFLDNFGASGHGQSLKSLTASGLLLSDRWLWAGWTSSGSTCSSWQFLVSFLFD